MAGTSASLLSRETRGRRVGLLLIAAVSVLLGAMAPALPGWRLVDLRLFDLLSTVSPTPPSDRVVVVAIDEPSFGEVGRQWPWPRSLHGRLVEAVRGAGAVATGIDVIFAEPSVPDEDAALAGTLGPDTVLASDETVIDMAQALQVVRTEPLPALLANGAESGLASLVLDADGVARRLPGDAEGLPRRLLAAAGIETPPPPPGALMAVAGPARTVQTVSYYQAMEPDAFLPPSALDDRIVLVGLSMQSAPTIDGGGADAYATSYTSRSERLVPGVEILATAVSNLLTGTFFVPADGSWRLIAVVAAAVLAVLAVRRETGIGTLGTGLAGAGLAVGGSLALLLTTRVWLPPTAPVLAFATILGVQGALDFSRERRIRRQVTTAFRHYLAPELVERLARDPTLLRTGGERRTVTVLFCDVRGFTTIAESMKDDPQGLTALINRLLDPLSAEILSHGGTIDKYIGDCVMAFWNAPLDDPDHAAHAVEAGLAMAAAAVRFDRLLADERRGVATEGTRGPRLAVGIGINTGDVVVGNMGSSARFDYTVLGDAVNLAARLETTTRTYDVPIVIGEETRRLVADRYATALLDRVAVKGRRGAEPVHTVLGRRGEVPQDILALHGAVVEEALAGRPVPGDPRTARLSAALPSLAGFYRGLAGRAGTTSSDPPS